MGLHTVPMRMFLGTIARWLEALEKCNADEARYFVHELHVASEMLAIDPQFRALFREQIRNCEISDPKIVVSCLQAFLAAVTEAGQPGKFRNGTEGPSSASADHAG